MALQQQQQEIIKLLTQHFHQQFYQLANNNSNKSNQHTQMSSHNSNSSSTSLNAQQFAHQDQRPRNHFIDESVALPLSSNSFDVNNIADNNNKSHHLRSQLPLLHKSSPIVNSSNSPTIASNENQTINEQMSAAAAAQNFYEMNLLNAFGLNIAANLGHNNPFMRLPGQHQSSLMQAAASNRHYNTFTGTSLLRDFAEDPVHSQMQNLGYWSSMGQSVCNPTANSIIVNSDSGESEARKNSLKFSINTILGRAGSPHNGVCSTRSEKPSIQDNLNSESSSSHSYVRHTSIDNQNDSKPMLGPMDPDHNLHSPRSNESIEDQTESMDSCSSIPSKPTSDISILLNQNNNQQAISIGHVGGGLDRCSAIDKSLPPSNASTATNYSITAPTSSTTLALRNQKSANNRYQSHQHSSFNPFMAPGTAAFPWTVTARGKPRRGMMRRAVFSDNQRIGLEKRFQLQKYISKPDRKKLAEKLGLRDSQVKIWFQNRRMKWRNSKERELLSTGGSREQTLPTRNNPNPDLSDVGETAKRLAAATSASLGTNTSAIANIKSPSEAISNPGGNNLQIKSDCN